MKEVKWKIDGMHCGGCATGIEFMLSTKVGIKKSKVDFKTKILNIVFDPKKIKEKDIVKSIENLGYKVWINNR